MIWTMICKELKEHGKWLVLGAFAAMFYLYTDIIRGHTQMPKVILHISVVTGIILGLLQTLPEKHLRLLPFLTHRPVTLLSIFVAKIIAAVILFSIAVIVPYFVTTMIVSDEISMLIYHLNIQIVINMLFGLVAYFLTITIVLREARFYGSRAVGILFGIICYYAVYQIPTKGHLIFLMACVGFVAISSAWGAFSDKLSNVVVKTSLSIILLISYTTVILFIIDNIEMAAKRLSTKKSKNDSNIYYRVTSQGLISLESKKAKWVYKDENNNILLDKYVDKIFDEELLGMYLSQKPIANTKYLLKRYHVRLMSGSYYSKLQKRIIAYDRDGTRQGSIGIDGFYNKQVKNLHKEDYFGYEDLNKKILMQSKRELHLFDRANKKIDVLFSSPEIIHKFSVVISEKNIPIEIIVVTERHLYVLDTSGKTISKIEHIPLQEYDKIKILVTNKKQYIFRYIKATNQKDKVVEYSKNGYIIKEYTVPKNLEYMENYNWPMYFLKSTVLSDFACRYFIPDLSLPDYKISLLWLIIIPSLMCLLITQFYAVSTRETICWLIICSVSGIPGLLTFLSICKFSVVHCHSCNKKHNLQNECCQKCSAKLNKPAPDGTEIFA
ncbi:hypothetical protein [Candidatus Uabimicrobium sp. HlEnr_7]|uniref:hypothetical protein n=1 Tax=Candidatus Uabimicrobium helgolandensis TaxID=3095367 RepID=UPI0035580AC1